MRHAPPTQARLKSLINYDFETGKLTWKVNKSRMAKLGNEAGWANPHGRYVRIDARDYAASALIWYLLYNHWPAGAPTEVVDHIDGNPFNNRPHNLRLATSSQNSMNQKVRSDSSTGIKGIHVDKSRNKYLAHIAVAGKWINLGRFATLEEAVKAREQAELKYFGEFVRK